MRYQTWLIIILKIWHKFIFVALQHWNLDICACNFHRQKKVFPFSCSYLNASPTNVHSVSWWYTFGLSLGYRFKARDLLRWWTTGEQIKELCELYVWWLGNSKYKARLISCGGEGHFIPSECIVASRKAVCYRVCCWNCNAEPQPKKYLLFKICVRNITLSEYTGVQFKFYKHRICTFIWKWVSVWMHKSLYLKTVNVYKQYMSKHSTSKLQMYQLHLTEI